MKRICFSGKEFVRGCYTLLGVGLYCSFVSVGIANAWKSETGSINSGNSRSIKIDSLNQPHIAYIEYNGSDHYLFRYSKKTDGLWTPKENVADFAYSRISLALDASDNPHFAFGLSGSLTYRNKIGNVWGSTQTVDNVRSDYISMALTSTGLPRIAYYSNATKDLKFAEWTGSLWSTKTIDSVGDVGPYVSLSLDSMDHPRIAYYDATNSDLKYAEWDGTNWSTQTVDSIGNVGSVCSLALTDSGQPWISYLESTKGVKVAHRSGSEWVVETLSKEHGIGNDSALALSMGNIPAIIFGVYLGYESEIWVAEFRNSSWRYTLIMRSAVAGLTGNANATTGKDGLVHVAFGGYQMNNHCWQVAITEPGQPSASKITQTSIAWAWTESSDFEEGFRVRRLSDDFNLSGDLPPDTTSWVQTNISPNTGVQTYVEAFRGVQIAKSDNSYNQYTLSNPPVDSKVTSVTAHSLSISWSRNGNPDTTPFRAEISTDNVNFSSVYTSANTSVTATGLISGTTYFVRVQSKNNGSTYSAFDVTVSTRLPFSIPAAPSQISGNSLGSDRVVWGWKDNANDEQGYRVVRASDGVSLSGDLPPNTVSWTHEGLTPTSPSEVRIVAFNEAGASQTDKMAIYSQPYPPQNPHVMSVSDGSIGLVWENHPLNPPSVNTIVSYSTYPFKTDSDYWDYHDEWVSGGKNELLLSNLQPMTSIYFRLFSYRDSRSVPSVYFSSATLPGRPWAPTQPSASTNTVNSITWKWLERSTNEEGVRVLDVYGVDKSGPLPAGTTFWTQAGLPAGTNQVVSVETFNSYGSSRSANSLASPTVPASPTHLSWTMVGASSATLAWTAEGNLGSTYVLTQSTNNVVFKFCAYQINGQSAAISNLFSETTYYFKLQTRNDLFQYSEISPVLSVVTLAGPPQPPSGLTLVTRSTSSLSWRWADQSNNEDGFRILDLNNVNLSGDLPSGTTYWFQGNLSPARPMQVRVEAFNTLGMATSDYSSTRYTLPSTPADLAFTIVQSSAIVIQWSTNGNWPGTVYNMEARGKDYALNLSTPGAGISFSNLVGESTYTFRVYATNPAYDSSGYSSAISTRTPPGAPVKPSSLIVWDRSATSLTWNWSDNSANELGFRFRDAKDDSDISGILPPNTTYWLQRDLLPKTDYQVYVEAFNDLGVTTSSKIFGTTLANPPSPFGYDLLGSTRVVLSWGLNRNPASLLYRLQVSKEASFATLDRNIGSVGGTTLSLSGLTPATTYFFRVRGDYLTSPYTLLGPVVTPAPGISLASFDSQTDRDFKTFGKTGEIRARLLKDSFPSVVSLKLTEEANFPPATSPTQHIRSTGKGIQITIDQPWQPSRPITISIPYSNADIAGHDESKLALARYDGTLGNWIILPSAVDANANRITATSDQLALFQIVSLVISDSVSEAMAYPNPWRPGHAGQESLTFTRLPLNATLKIYTQSGELVKMITSDINGVASWNGNNEEGASVASGVYIVRIEGTGGDKILKVAVQR